MTRDELLTRYAAGERDFSWANLEGAKLDGANLGGATLYRANLEGANLSRANLSRANLSWANLGGANLGGADLSWAKLYGADLYRAKLYRANLSGANMEGADLSGANLEGATLPTYVVSIPGIDGVILDLLDDKDHCLDMGRWHTCATTHCRAGWAIVLAGDAGRALENCYGASVAGALIYAASGSHPVPDWIASDSDAIADMAARAGRKQTVARPTRT